ncbi:MAG TPA: acetyl-CoA carboxylase biotin carboxyl carrier protein [Pyrinomonadaceae bacterium]|jgi:acetyl-CoA carboxylase biotin carboxyl carrier protein|nr:acetyl-CoA carboxylase biotin carboxyl carrier protein [Pyrinomonadaceae bacterium]
MSAAKEQSETPNRRARSASRPAPSVNMEELRELITLLRENGLSELELENEGFKVRLRRESTGGESVRYAESPPAPAAPPIHAPAPPPTSSGPSHPGTQASTAASQDQDLHIIPSPIVGTFYRSPSPTAEAFVKIGSNVEPDTVVCIIEAMKLMNEIQAETAGEVVKIYVENGQPVEYGQPLFGIKS